MSEAIKCPDIKKACVEALYKICNQHDLLPGPMRIEPAENPTGTTYDLGEFVAAFKCEHREREAAAKALRASSDREKDKVIIVSRCRLLCT